MKKISIISLVVFLLNISLVSAYNEVSCSSDSVFSANSCNRCFDGGNKASGDNLESLSDVWINSTTSDYIVYKEEQEMPKIVNLGGINSSWVTTPSSANFWEYTDEFNSLYSDTEQGNILSAGGKVTWIRSKLGYTYTLETNTAPQGDNIGLLVYSLISHKLSSSGSIDVNGTTNNECILFKSGDNVKKVVVPPKKLPDTGPAEYILLLALAMVLGFTIIKSTKRI